MATRPDLSKLEQFLYLEARLLDEKRWDEWEALFIEDGEYWIPATHGQPDPLNHVSIMYEKSLLRAVRLKRYRHPNAMSLQPVPQSVHTVSNIMLDSFDEASGVCVVNSRFVVLEHRRDTAQTYGGSYFHTLEPHDDSYRIRLKKVELINCDGILNSIQIYL
jgi:3-phenylpropionate/cinnamic acid dioxygenase small subunit